MTPKEKAKRLVEEFEGLQDECDCLEYMCVCSRISKSLAQQVALICVNEILENIKLEYSTQDLNYKWWFKVKQVLKDNFN